MGNSQTFGMTQDVLEDYEQLTYLSKSEIMYFGFAVCGVVLGRHVSPPSTEASSGPLRCPGVTTPHTAKPVLKKFHSIDPKNFEADFHYRIHMDLVKDKFPVLRHNPFQDRLFHVFSSKRDGCFSFEDMLDLCSVMSAECPDNVKATWAFRIFDIDGDNQIGEEDISDILDRLVWDYDDPSKLIERASKEKIATILLQEMDLHNIGSMSLSEFRHAMSKMPEFSSSFYFRL